MTATIPAAHVPLIDFKSFNDWNEETGDVLWFRIPFNELPYVGTPLDLGHAVEMHGHKGMIARGTIGGWPYSEDDEPNLRWTKLPIPEMFLKVPTQ